MPLIQRSLALAGLCSACAVAFAAEPAQATQVQAPVAPLPPPVQPDAAGKALENANQTLNVDTDTGVVTDQAVTVAGQDFYQYFVNAWRDKEGSERYSLAVHERPSARWGSEIWIEFAQRRVFRTYLPPARAAIKPISEQAAEIAYRAVLQADIQRQLVNDADLGRDEI